MMNQPVNIAQFLTRKVTMKTSRLIAGFAISLASPIAIASSDQEVNAQTRDFFQAVPGVRLCASIINLSNANPNHMPLRIAARECSFIEYRRSLCLQSALAQFPPPPPAVLDQCWRGYITLTPNIRAISSQLNR